MKKLAELAKRIKDDIFEGENLDNYLAILLGIIFTVWGIFGQIPQDWLNNLLILTLTLLLLGSLKTRYLLQDTKSKVSELTTPDSSHIELKDRTEYESLEVRLTGADEVYIIGRHLSGFLGFNKDVLRKFAKQGCTFKLVILNPVFFPSDGESSTLEVDVQRSISILKQLVNDCPGKFHLKLAEKLLPLAVFAVDIENLSGLIQVQPHPLYLETDLRPHFDLQASVHAHWYHHYKEQVKLAWENSEEYPLTDPVNAA